MAFEVYTPRKGKQSIGKKEKQAVVSLSRNSLVLNKLAREQLNSTNIEFAFDPVTNKIRISPSDDGQSIKKTKVPAVGFFKYFGIEDKGKFAAEYDHEENALYVDLNQSM